jgi:hypothetical protein
MLLDSLVQDWNLFWGTVVVLSVISTFFGVIAWLERKQKRKEAGRKNP